MIYIYIYIYIYILVSGLIAQLGPKSFLSTFGEAGSAVAPSAATTPAAAAATGAAAEDAQAPMSQLFADAARFGPVTGGDAFQAAVERGLVDVAAVVCLVCKRKLDAVEKLVRHVNESKLHETNMEAERTRLLQAMS